MIQTTHTQFQPPCGLEERYPALRSIIIWYKILAWLIIIGAVIVSVLAGVLFDAGQSIPFIMITLFLGIVGFINFIAIGEGIKVILDIEQNTRNMCNR